MRSTQHKAGEEKRVVQPIELQIDQSLQGREGTHGGKGQWEDGTKNSKRQSLMLELSGRHQGCTEVVLFSSYRDKL